MKVKFWGVRGSIPTPGPNTVRYGGNSTCYEVRNDKGELVILDAGSGIRELGLSLLGELPLSTSIFITHTHVDHIMGYPFFVPAYIPGNRIKVHGPANFDSSFTDVMKRQMDYSYFPIRLEELMADISYHDMEAGEHEIDGFKVMARPANHPIMCQAYRIEADGKSVVFTGDTEPYMDNVFGDREPEDDEEREEKEEVIEFVEMQNAAMAQFCQGADLVIYDCMYTEEEYSTKKGWGHTTMEYAIEACLSVGVKRLAMSHHEPIRGDDAMDALQEKFRNDLKERGETMEVGFAVEGETVEL